jgi:hypothetical protein
LQLRGHLSSYNSSEYEPKTILQNLFTPNS